MIIKNRRKVQEYGKESHDGIWKADLYKLDDQGPFRKWAFQQYKKTPLGWEPMGEQETFAQKSVAMGVLTRLGYVRLT